MLFGYFFFFWRLSSFLCLLVSSHSFTPFSWLAEAAGNDRSVWSYLTGRAAAMASIHEPSDGDIQNFIGFTGASQSRAIQYLKVWTKENLRATVILMWTQAHSKDLERAINAYFDNPSAVFDQVSVL